MIREEDHKRMLWASRRGMLELDLVLEPFVQRMYPRLDSRERASYERLMTCEDQQLFGWFLRRKEPEDAELAALIQRILAFKQSQGLSEDG